MKPTVLAVRAIGAEFARRLWNPSFAGAIGISIAMIALLLWLTSFSSWWWLLSLPIGIAMSVAAVLLIIFRLLIRHVRPPQTPDQSDKIRTFVDKLQLLSEITGTPKIIMLFRTIRSIAAPSSDSYLQDIFETKDLKKDFKAIISSFSA